MPLNNLSSLYAQKKQKGFTLIELLVVIAIIGILATIVLVSVNSVRAKARDSRRKADLRQIKIGLEMYYDEHGSYINVSESCCTDSSVGCGGCGCTITNYPNGSDWDSNSDLRDLVSAGFLAAMPLDPINNSTYFYHFEPNCTSQGNCIDNCCEYVLRTRLESGGYWYDDSFGIGVR